MKFKPALLTCLCICFFFIANGAKAQTSDAQYFVPEPFPKSPNVASFTKYGDYQVNMFTGVPNISIPLYTIEAGGLKVPIELSYHASGVKVTDVASWVGLGWSIPGGGAVSRKIIGGPDDGVYGYMRGYLRQVSTLNMGRDADMLYVDNIANGTYDGRPDIFSYDIPGHSGKFFFNGTNGYKPTLFPYAPIGISYTLGSSALTNFSLTDEQGNYYKFGDAATETTQTSGAGKVGTPVNTSWLMESMISQNRKDTINFSYGSDFVLYPDATSQMQVLTDQIFNVGNAPYPYNPSNIVGSTTSISTGVQEKPLQQISFKNGKVVFDYDPSVRQDINLGAGNNVHGLADIKVYSYNYNTKMMELQKTILFYKSYFGTSAANNLRLRLDSIQILDKAGSVIQHYRFGYNTSITLPTYGSFARDYWGYYNGKTTSNSLIPQMTVPYNGGNVTIGSNVANNRNCDSNYMQAYVLNTIYYPTGGYTNFTYQSNQFTNYLGQVQVAGGLRVKSISSFDNVNSVAMVKTYQYNLADSNYVLQYSFFAAPPQTHRYYISDLQRGYPAALYFCTVRNFVSNPNIDLDPLDAAPVVYPNVTEYIGTPSTTVGTTNYIYNFLSDNLQDASMGCATPIVTSYFYTRGQLLSKTESIKQSNGTYQPVKTESNTYSAFQQKQYIGVGIVARKINTNEGIETGATIYSDQISVTPTDSTSYTYANYWIYSQDNQLTSTTTKVYDTNNPTLYTTSTVNYIYDDTTHLQVARTRHVDSKGNTHITVNMRPYNYLSGSTTHNPVLDSMINRHMYSEIVEKWDSVKDVAAATNFVSGAQFNTYQTGSLPGSIVPWKISTLAVSSPITNFSPLYVNTGTGALTADTRYVQRISFDAYDSQNNIAQYTPRNGTTSVILWDYLSENPIAQVKNIPSGATSTAYTSFEANGKGNWIFSGTPVSDLTAPTGKMVYPLSSGSITYNYSPLTSYVLSYWSNNGAATVTLNSGAITGNNLSTSGNWTYYEHIVPATAGTITISGSTSIDELRLYPVNAQMSTYAYEPEGLMTMADTKGGINHFEYDYFARLKNIKDFYGNIVNNYGYHTYDQTIGNQAYSSSFTRNNCPTGTTPGSLTYVVPANKYYSSTLASANAEATYDLNTNGQAKANQNCGCPITTTSFTLSNSTGINGFQVTFSGISSPYNFPATGSTVIQVPVGTYATIKAGPFGSATHTFSLTGQSTQSNVHYATFTNVAVTSGSNLTLSIQ